MENRNIQVFIKNNILNVVEENAFNDKSKVVLSLPCYEYTEKVNDIVFRKNIVIDLVNCLENDVVYLFDNIKDISFMIWSYYYKYMDNRYIYNNSLFFTYDNNLEKLVDKYYYGITRDLECFKMDFISKDEMNNLVNKNILVRDCNMFDIKNKEINLNGFNLLHGNNGSGKTMLLKDISNKFDTPIFNLYNYELGIKKIENTELFKYYYKLLTGNDNVLRYSGSDQIYYWLSIALAYGKLDNKLVLLDDISWGVLDTLNKINIMDMLNDYSYSNGVISTSCQNDVKTLVKRRVFNPNIIDL